MPYFADPGQQIPALSREQLIRLISGAQGLFCNDYEFDLIRHKMKTSLEKLLIMTQMIIVTLGAKGSVIYNKNREIKVPAVKVRKIVDPTGAGDAYRAGFLKGLANNWSLKKCGQLAAWVAKHPVEHYGTQEHSFHWHNK